MPSCQVPFGGGLENAHTGASLYSPLGCFCSPLQALPEPFPCPPAQSSLQIFPGENSLLWCFPDVQAPRQHLGGRGGCSSLLVLNQPCSDSERESQRLPQFSDSHDRSPLGTRSSEPCRLPEIVTPASASSLRYPFGFAVVFQETCSGRTFIPPQERWVAGMKMHFGLPSRCILLIPDAHGTAFQFQNLAWQAPPRPTPLATPLPPRRVRDESHRPSKDIQVSPLVESPPSAASRLRRTYTGTCFR